MIYNQYSNVAAKTIVDSSGRSRIFSADSGKTQLCDSYYSKEFDYIDIDISACPAVSEDVRVKFHCSSKEVKKAYEKCAFYFWYVFWINSIISNLKCPNFAIWDLKNYLKLFIYLSRFHTAFLEPDSDNLYYLKLQRDEIDNPHKPKSWSELGGTYPENFQIEIFLSPPLQKERY